LKLLLLSKPPANDANVPQTFNGFKPRAAQLYHPAHIPVKGLPAGNDLAQFPGDGMDWHGLRLIITYVAIEI
jgi:hypothetical protein